MGIPEILAILKKWLLLIIILPIVVTLTAGLYYFKFAKPVYTSTSQILVFHLKDESNITASDLSLSSTIISDFRAIILTRPVMEETARRMNIPLSQVGSCSFSVANLTNTRIVRISVSSSDPVLATGVAKAFTLVATDTARTMLQTEQITEIQPASNAVRTGPPSSRNTLMAFALSLAAALAAALLIELLNTTIRTQQDIEKQLGIPLLAKIPRFEK